MHEHVGLTSFVVFVAYAVIFLAVWRIISLRLPDDSPAKAGMAALL